MSNPELKIENVFDHMKPFIEGLRSYHQHRIYGLEKVPKSGGVLMVCNHSLATYDLFLFATSLVDYGRLPYSLGDNLIFKFPLIKTWAKQVGVYPASHEHGEEFLLKGHPVLVAPGGMKEALRNSNLRYQTRWKDRKGFVKLALRTQAPIQLVACPAADRIFRVYESKITRMAYDYLKIPLPVLRGWGPSLIPRPVKVVHLIGEQLFPPPLSASHFESQVDQWHSEILDKMQLLMTEAKDL